MPNNFDVLEARVSSLEKQNRWLKFGCIGCFLAFASILTMGQAKTGTIEAQRFVLKSAKGETWGEFSTDGDYAHLNLRSPNGDMEVHLSPVGMSLSDHGLPGKLPLAYYGNRGLYLADGEGNVLLEVGGAATEHLQMTAGREIKIFGKNGNVLWQAP